MSVSEVASDDIERMSRRFTVLVLTIVVLGMAATTTVAIVADPFGVLGTGAIPSNIVNDREIKPKLFLEANPPPRAIILGSSRVWKFNPSCITELTGMPAFNFGMALAEVEDWDVILRFIADRGRVPLGAIVIGIEADAFDTHSSHQLELSSYLGRYTDDPGLSWTEITKSLFGGKTFQQGLRSIWRNFRPQDGDRPNIIEPNGFRIEPEREDAIRAGTYSVEKKTAAKVLELKRRAIEGFDRLNPKRVVLFRKILEEAKRAGITVYAVAPPMSRRINEARSGSEVTARTLDLNALLAGYERENLLRYYPVELFTDLSEDPNHFFDGIHLTEQTSSRVLLRMFHREHGCGL